MQDRPDDECEKLRDLRESNEMLAVELEECRKFLHQLYDAGVRRPSRKERRSRLEKVECACALYEMNFKPEDFTCEAPK